MYINKNKHKLMQKYYVLKALLLNIQVFWDVLLRHIVYS